MESFDLNHCKQRTQQKRHSPRFSRLVAFTIALLVLCSQMQFAEGRKSYIVKERIKSGDLKVHRPRVHSSEAQFCMFKDDNNDWCVDMDESWTLSLNHEYVYDETTDAYGVPASYRGYQMYNSTQAASWSTAFNLARLWYSSLKMTLDEFHTGFRFELFYWIEDYAFCMNFVQFTTPVTITITIDNKLEECSKTLIDCFDDWTTWTSDTADMLENCALSTSTEWALWQYSPWEGPYDRYYFGEALYNQAVCFPGFSPFYSYHNKYPANPFLQIFSIIEDVYNFGTSLSAA